MKTYSWGVLQSMLRGAAPSSAVWPGESKVERQIAPQTLSIWKVTDVIKKKKFSLLIMFCKGSG